MPSLPLKVQRVGTAHLEGRARARIKPMAENTYCKVYIMELHTKPITFLDKLLEHSKFSIETYEWDPLLTDLSLNDYIKKHSKIIKINKAIKKANDEWDSFEGE